MAYNNERKTAVIDREAELHNSRINGRYALLQDTENDLQTLWEEARLDAQAAVIAPEKPAETPFGGHTRIESDLFTSTTLDRTLQRNLPAEQPVFTPVNESVAPQEEHFAFSLTAAAKKAIAIFASAATVMLAVICVNTHLINNREAQIRALEESNASRRASITKLEESIARKSSKEEIKNWWESEETQIWVEESGLLQK